MITAICLNPCIDKTVEIDAFTFGGMNRIQSARLDGSGKGVNVAIACRQLGLDSTCLGFLYEDNGKLISQRMGDAGVCVDVLWEPGAVRTNTKLLERASGIITEINEKGMLVSETQMAALRAQVADYATRSSLMVFTGSLPPGCPPDTYRQLMDAAMAQGCKCLLDAEGAVFEQGLASVPFMVKPNQFELEQAVGHILSTQQDILHAAQEIIARGVSVVVVSMGGDGALATNGREAYYAPVLRVQVNSTVGAGDSMVAGLCAAYEANMPFADMLRHGVAAATASVTTTGTGLIDVAKYRELLSCVQLEALA